MYKIKNVSLDQVFKDYKVTSLDAMSKEELYDVLELFNIPRKPQKRKAKRISGNLTENPFAFQGKNGLVVGDMDKYDAIDLINAELTYSDYMPKSYWTDAHRQKADEYGIEARLGEVETGDELFENFATIKLGFYKLKPGDDAIVDYTKDYVELDFLKIPAVKEGRLSIVDMENPDKDLAHARGLGGDVKKNNKAQLLRQVEAMSYNQLRQEASRRGLTSDGKKGEVKKRVIDDINASNK